MSEGTECTVAGKGLCGRESSTSWALNGSKRSMTTPTSDKALNTFDRGGAQVDARLWTPRQKRRLGKILEAASFAPCT